MVSKVLRHITAGVGTSVGSDDLKTIFLPSTGTHHRTGLYYVGSQGKYISTKFYRIHPGIVKSLARLHILAKY